MFILCNVFVIKLTFHCAKLWVHGFMISIAKFTMLICSQFQNTRYRSEINTHFNDLKWSHGLWVMLLLSVFILSLPLLEEWLTRSYEFLGKTSLATWWSPQDSTIANCLDTWRIKLQYSWCLWHALVHKKY